MGQDFLHRRLVERTRGDPQGARLVLSAQLAQARVVLQVEAPADQQDPQPRMRPGLADHGGHGVENLRVAAGHDADGIELVEDDETIAPRGQSGEQRHGGLMLPEEPTADLSGPLGRVEQVQSNGEYRPTRLGHLPYHLGNHAGLADSRRPLQENRACGRGRIEQRVGDPLRFGPPLFTINSTARPASISSTGKVCSAISI
jgi:hypothetical protein